MRTRMLVLAFLALGSFGAAGEEAPDARGLTIAEEADRRDQGWGDSATSMKMVLRNRNGDESVRELRRLALEMDEKGAGDKSLITFDAPRDVAGTSLLSHTKILDPDDPWEPMRQSARQIMHVLHEALDTGFPGVAPDQARERLSFCFQLIVGVLQNDLVNDYHVYSLKDGSVRDGLKAAVRAYMGLAGK